MIEIPDRLSQSLARAIAIEIRHASDSVGYAEHELQRPPSAIEVGALKDAIELSKLPVVRNYRDVKAALLHAEPTFKWL